jgi:hypothetical protein
VDFSNQSQKEGRIVAREKLSPLHPQPMAI